MIYKYVNILKEYRNIRWVFIDKCYRNHESTSGRAWESMLYDLRSVRPPMSLVTFLIRLNLFKISLHWELYLAATCLFCTHSCFNLINCLYRPDLYN